MKLQTFEKSKYVDVMSYQAWQELEPLIPDGMKHEYFHSTGRTLLLGIVAFFLRKRGFPATVAKHNQEFTEIQSHFNGKFVVLIILSKRQAVPDKSNFQNLTVQT